MAKRNIIQGDLTKDVKPTWSQDNDFMEFIVLKYTKH